MLRTAARVQMIVRKSLGIYLFTKWSLWDDRLSLGYTQVYRWRVVSGFTVCSCPSNSRAPRYPIEYDAKGMHLPFQSLYGIGSSSFRMRRWQAGIAIVRSILI